MIKKMIISIGIVLLSVTSLAHAAPDVIRERQGLEVLSAQLAKLNELARSIQKSSDPSAKIQFNYMEFQRQTELLRRGVNDYLYRPLKPVPQSLVNEKFKS